MRGQINAIRILIVVLGIAATQALAQTPVLLRSALSAGGSSGSINIAGNSYLIQQSIGQGIVGSVQPFDKVLHQGFIQPYGYHSKAGSESLLHATIFPNPFSAQLTIQLGGENTGLVSITLSDILGRVVYSKSIEGQELIYIEPDALPPGYYIIRIHSDKKAYTSKLVKE